MRTIWLRYLRRWLQQARGWVFTLIYRLTCATRPIRPGSVILVSNRRATLSDNLLSIYVQLTQHEVSLYFFPPGSGVSLAGLINRLRFVRDMAQTEYTIIDDFFPLVYPLRVRPGTHLVQVWHALGAFKLVGFSRRDKPGGAPLWSISHRNYTDVIVSSEAIRRDYAEAFAIPLDRVHATGIPRSDLLFDTDTIALIRESVFQRVPSLVGRRVILFAPTFRGRDKKTAHYPDHFIDLAVVGAGLGDNDVLVLRMHPFVKRRPVIPPEYADRIIDLSTYPEFNHLLLVADLLVTDYSSGIFEAALLNLPTLFYVPDLETYTRTRGFYYDFEQYAFGPVVRDLPRLLEAIPTAENDPERLVVFREKFLNRCDGQATQRFVETVFQPRGNDSFARLGQSRKHSL